MNKVLCTTALLLGATSAAFAAPRAITPANDKAFTLEAVHNYGNQLESDGIRLGLDFYKNSVGGTFVHQFSVNLGYATDTTGAGNGATDWSYIPLTVGYYANVALTDKVTAFAGARVGMMRVEWDPTNGQGDDTNGIYGAVGVGLKFRLTETAHLQVSYEVGQWRPSDDEKLGYEQTSSRTLGIGFGIAF